MTRQTKCEKCDKISAQFEELLQLSYAIGDEAFRSQEIAMHFKDRLDAVEKLFRKPDMPRTHERQKT